MTTLAVLLCLCHAVLAVTATAEKSMTADEIAHFTAGQAYNTRGDFRLQPENGNLPQRLAALPMTLGHVSLPSPALESWRTADVWNYGHTFFYTGTLLADEWMFLGRGMIALVSGATGLLIFLWSRSLFGERGAFLSLLLFVFCPAFLAHGALATSDVVMTFFFVASLGSWWRHLNRPGATWAAISAITLGLAFVAKFSAVLLPPMLVLSGIGWIAGEARNQGWRAPLVRVAKSTLLHVVVVTGVIWLFYGFRHSAFAPSLAGGATFNHGWGWILNGIGAPAKSLWWLNEYRVLPEAWLYGLAFVVQFSQARGAFMSGEYGLTGWVSFFPWAFTIKSTLPFLGLVLLGIVRATNVAIGRIRQNGAAAFLQRILPLIPLAALFIVYWATSLTTHLNIGHRHILPTYPVLFIAAGWLGKSLEFRRSGWAAVIVGLAGWHAVESLAARPNYLAYFNQIVGGSKNGWRHLVDSSLDWGQELPALKRWLVQNGGQERIYLSYFGTGDPVYEGIKAVMLPTLPEVGPPRRWHRLESGTYAISATMLQHVYSQVRGDWTPALERQFQDLRPIEPTLLAYQNDPTQRAALSRDVPDANWVTAWKRYEQLRFARLCHYLRVRQADAVIGHSIFIFRLNAQEVAAATAGDINAWRDLLEKAVTARAH